MAKNRLRVIFATFSAYKNGERLATNGMVEPMLSYFAPKTQRFVVIDQPYPGSDILTPIIEIYKKGKLSKKTYSSFFVRILNPLLATRNTMGTRIPFKLRDFLSVIDFVVRDRKKFDLFIGLESINALAGVVLKKTGFVNKVVYYVSDYSPIRYRKGWFNQIYLILDRLACQNSDFIWDVSPAMMPARKKAGLTTKKIAPVVLVPNALFPKQINYLPQNKVIPYSMVYAGTLGKENGPDLAIESLAKVIKDTPLAKLHIYGGGEIDLKRLKRLAVRLKVRRATYFHGFISDPVKLSNEIRSYSVGLAPYRAITGDPRWWADATKIRLYLGAGLPVITTQVPPLGKELIKESAGLVVKDSPESLYRAIVSIFKNKNLYLKLRNNAIRKAKDNTWEKSYANAMDSMFL